MLQYTIVKTPEEEWITVYAPGRDPLPASSSHPNFEKIVDACRAESASPDEIADMFDVAVTVERQFRRLSERVTVNADGIFLDGDPVHGTLQTQILDFLDAGEDFGPLVNFYEKLTTNPLGDVRDGLYDWIRGQTENGGKLTITPDGNILGYKSMQSAAPEWRTDQVRVWVPSRRGEGIVNGVDVGARQYIEQVPGDVVEMPRSRVLHAPSQACGDGLHIGTYSYAVGFSGDTVMLVEFSPRDIVSLPDSASTWKLRVCRYTVVGPVDSPLDVPVFLTARVEPEGDDDPMDLTFEPGDRVEDEYGDEGVVVDGPDEEGDIEVQYDNSNYGTMYVAAATMTNLSRPHGKGGPTSYAAKGRGRNPAQDEKGRFSTGRPGSARDSKTGRFV